MSKLYHQTDAETAEVILRTQRMKPGSGGLAGGGIYFATTPELTDMAHGLNSASKLKPTPPSSQPSSTKSTARTDGSDFLDDLKEAEARDEAKAKTKAEKAATSATKKPGKEAGAAKKKTRGRLCVSAKTACSKQSSAAP
jgi:hypothetical protein